MPTALLAAMLFAAVPELPPLPWDRTLPGPMPPLLSPALDVGAATNGVDVTPPSIPSLRAALVKNMLMRWQAASDTNTTFIVFKSTNLVTWTTFTNLPYHASVVMIETPWDARGFFVLGRSNTATGLRFK